MTGSIQIKNGKYYTVINLPCKDGKYGKKYEATGLAVKGNKHKAEQILRERIINYSNTPVEPSEVLFCDFVSEWVKSSKGKVQHSTYDGYIHMLDRHIYPYFKELGLTVTKIEPFHIQQYYTVKLGEGLNPNTVIKHHAIIRTALQSAKKQGIVKDNAADLAEKPKRQRYNSEFYNVEEINELFKVIKGKSVEIPVLLTAYFGLRRSEVLGLKWKSVDFNNRTISISHKVVRAKIDGKLTFIQTDDLKTHASYRTLPLADNVLEYLTDLKRRQERNKRLCGDSYILEFDDYICVNEMGDLLKPDYVSDRFGKEIDRAGLKHIRFHDLRHSCASLLLSLGYSMKDIQEWLGHSNYQTTANLYAHVDPKNKRSMANGISGVLSL